MGLGDLVMKSTVKLSTLMIRSTVASLPLTSESFARARLYENTTSSALNGVPSWNCTPLRRWKRQCLGPISSQRSARAGSIDRSGARPTRPSNTLPSAPMVKVSFNEYGSMEWMVPWNAHRSSLACSDAARTAISAPASKKFLVRIGFPPLSLLPRLPNYRGCLDLAAGLAENTHHHRASSLRKSTENNGCGNSHRHRPQVPCGTPAHAGGGGRRRLALSQGGHPLTFGFCV